MQIEFRDTYSRWQLPKQIATPSGRSPDELHVEPKKAAVRKQLLKALEAGDEIEAAGNYNVTKYRVLREEDGVFVLVNSRGNVL